MAAGKDHTSDIDAPSAHTVPGSQLLPAASQAKLLSAAQQETYLHVLTRGASPASACGKVGVSALDVLATIEQDESFSERLNQVTVLLSQNVAAALYRSAMEGSVSAQTFFLKSQPPPNWHHSQPSEAADDPFSEMTDDELLAYCRASGIDWPTETEAGTDSAAVPD